MPINIGEYPEELQKMMAQMQASQGASGGSSGGTSVGGGGGFGSAMQNVVGGQAQQAGVMHGQVEDYAKAMRTGPDSGLDRFLYGMDQYGDGLPGGFKEGMALEEFGQLSMDQMGMSGVDPRGMMMDDFFNDPFAL